MNYTKLVLTINTEPKAIPREKDYFFTATGQWKGLNYITLVFDKKYLNKRAVLLKKGDVILVSGNLENLYNITKKKCFCTLDVKYFRK